MAQREKIEQLEVELAPKRQCQCASAYMCWLGAINRNFLFLVFNLVWLL